MSNILGYVLVYGRPNGAPRAACEDGTNIVPGHAPNPPSTSPVPYSVDISSLLNGYNPGENYNSKCYPILELDDYKCSNSNTSR